MVSVADAAEVIPLSAPTIRKSIEHLVELGILSEATGKRRDRIFVYTQYVKALSQGTEPII